VRARFVVIGGLSGAAAALLAACAGGSGVSSPADTAIGLPHPGSGSFRATVVRVVDGDTLLARRQGSAKVLRVRLIGVDAPESVKPDTPVACYGHEASAYATALLPRGLQITGQYEPGGRTDRFGRELWDVWTGPNGRFVQGELVRGGYARAREILPQHAHADYLAAQQRHAQKRDAGLWGACPP
jgi:micrococcal nuclease